MDLGAKIITIEQIAMIGNNQNMKLYKHKYRLYYIVK